MSGRVRKQPKRGGKAGKRAGAGKAEKEKSKPKSKPKVKMKRRPRVVSPVLDLPADGTDDVDEPTELDD